MLGDAGEAIALSQHFALVLIQLVLLRSALELFGRAQIQRRRRIALAVLGDVTAREIHRQSVPAALLDDRFKLRVGAADTTVFQQLHTRGDVDLVDRNRMKESRVFVSQVGQRKTRCDQHAEVREVSAGQPVQEVPQPRAVQASELATMAVLLHSLQAVEHDQTVPLLQHEQHLSDRQQRPDSRFAVHPHLQRLEKRVGVGSVVEREDERAVRRRQRRVLRNLRVIRQPTGQYPEKPLGHRRLSGPAHADQCTDAATAAPPPVADVVELRSMLPAVCSQEGVDEIVGHRFLRSN